MRGIQKIFSGGTTFRPGVVQQILPLQKTHILENRGGGVTEPPIPPPPLWIRPCRSCYMRVE